MTTPTPRRLVAAGALAAALVLATAAAGGSTRSNTALIGPWVTDDSVLAAVTTGHVTYIGGTFTFVAPDTGSFAPIGADGTAIATPGATGAVRAVAPDGK